ncbi:MAG: hypothetical protein KAI66_00255 [Lentisphaeria bacterium]|nr:hypothetical protein [Lentisphaeria bacterium]
MKTHSHVRFQVLAALVVIGIAVPCHAQIGISLKSRFDKYLRYEPIEMIVTLRNYSGNTLVFGGTDRKQGHLDFMVTSHANFTVPQIDRAANPVQDLILGAGETRQLKLRLNKIYDLQREGSYTVQCQIGHERQENDYRSNSITINVSKGNVVIFRRVGTPTTSTTERIKEVTASLVMFHDNHGAMYCLRVEDDRFVYDTIRLGPYIQNAKPEMDADSTSDIHILIMVRARLYSYSIYSVAGGAVKLRQQLYYASEPNIPHLSRKSGFLKVSGGRVAVEGKDYELMQPAKAER